MGERKRERVGNRQTKKWKSKLQTWMRETERQRNKRINHLRKWQRQRQKNERINHICEE